MLPGQQQQYGQHKKGGSPRSTSPLPQDFERVLVEGDAPPGAGGRRRKGAQKEALSNKMPEAKLNVFCYDRTTGEPISGVALKLVMAPELNPPKKKAPLNAGASANKKDRPFSSVSYSRSDGVVLVKLMPGRSYVATAS
eukprot:CAMPEP_0202389042 /NCGR_PEP_ID=MMETSP1127-20130417/80796_1 /ASSEMBLY_ACC=CAM_ASM_000462 /TAXON_ID=3047 /ORGANISM="Dunaliella tertiolecta, Strain CCMP1320" /LENGTH=138 /DNA_ID=CAMNT_0048990671 /DNA_START=162 /DNA_END=575 /DNA_ORIENTATION=+